MALQALPVWKIVGKLKQPDESERKSMRREVLLCAESFDAAVERAEEALLLNWSSNPHEVSIVSIVPVLVPEEYEIWGSEKEQMKVVYPSIEVGEVVEFVRAIDGIESEIATKIEQAYV